MRARLEALVAELRAHPQIEVTEANFGWAMEAEDIADTEAHHGVRLAPGLRDFYMQVGSFGLEWTTSDVPGLDGGEAWGLARFHDLHGILASGDMVEEWMSEALKADYVDYYVFDKLCFAQSEATVFYVEDGVLHDRLAYDVDDRIVSFDDDPMTAARYVDLLCRCKGLVGWQEALFLPYRDRRADFVRRITALFPDVDTSTLLR